MKILLNFRKAAHLSKTSLNSSNSNSSKSVLIQLFPSIASQWQMANKSMVLKPPFSHLIRSYPLAIWSSNRWHSKISSKSLRPLTVWNNFKYQESHPLCSSTISNSKIMAIVASSWSHRCKLLYLLVSKPSSSRYPEPLSSPHIWWRCTEAILWSNICAEILQFYESAPAISIDWWLQPFKIGQFEQRSTTSNKASNIIVHLKLSVAQYWTSICQF